MRTFSDFFGFTNSPFKREPDVAFYFYNSLSKPVLDELLLFVHSSNLFFVLTGAQGTGTTITLRKFISEIPSNFKVSFIPSAKVNIEELLSLVLTSLDSKTKAKTKESLIEALRQTIVEFHKEKKKILLVFDDAQNLPEDTLSALFSLSAIEGTGVGTLKIILAGKPELAKKISSEVFSDYVGDIFSVKRLENLSESEIKSYISERLVSAGTSPIKVHGGVIRKVAKITKGNPLLINSLMERAIIAAFLDNSYSISGEHLKSAVSSVNTMMSVINKERSRAKSIAFGIAAAAIILIAVGYFGYDKFDVLKSLPFMTNNSNTAVAQNVQLKEPKRPAAIEPNVVVPSVPPQVAVVPDQRPPQTPTNQEQADNRTTVADEPPTRITPIEVPPATPIVTQTSPQVATTVQPEGPTPLTADDINRQIERARRGTNNNPMPEGALVVVTSTSLNIRLAPMLDAPRVRTVLTGDKFVVVEDTADWVKVDVGGGRFGWMFKRYLKVEETSGNSEPEENAADQDEATR